MEKGGWWEGHLRHTVTAATRSHGSPKLCWSQRASPILLPPFGPVSMAQKQSVSVGRHEKIAQAYTAIPVLLRSIVLPFPIDFDQYDHLEKQMWLQRATQPFTTNRIFTGQHWVSPAQAVGQQAIHRNLSEGCGIPEIDR